VRHAKRFVTTASVVTAFLAFDAAELRGAAYFDVTGSSLTGDSILDDYLNVVTEEGLNTTIYQSTTVYVEVVSNMGNLLTSDSNMLEISGSASVYGTTRDGDYADVAGELIL